MRLKEKYHREISSLLSEYPDDHKRSAVMPLLFLAQQEYGYISSEAMDEVAALLGIDPTQVASIVGFYTLYHSEEAGTHRIQICTDLPCALRGAEQFSAQICEHLGARIGETTEDGMFTVEEVMCLAACDKAPMFQLQTRDGISYHEKQTLEAVQEMTDRLRADGME